MEPSPAKQHYILELLQVGANWLVPAVLTAAVGYLRGIGRELRKIALELRGMQVKVNTLWKRAGFEVEAGAEDDN